MAGKTFHDVQSGTRELKLLNFKVNIGASGAPTIVVAASNGLLSIVRNSAGLYTVTLTDKYPHFVGFGATLIIASAQDLNFQLAAETISSAGSFQFRCLTGATPTDPTNGAQLCLHVQVKNSSVGI